MTSWGLAFKPNTDDLREAAALDIVDDLLMRGASVRVYDPAALDGARQILIETFSEDAALLDGLEWNVKLAGSHTPELLAKFEATFDSYWADPAFAPYNPDTDAARLDEALAIAGGLQDRGTVTFMVSGLEVRPYTHQQEILDRLQVEREVHGHHCGRSNYDHSTVTVTLPETALSAEVRLASEEGELPGHLDDNIRGVR